MTYPLRTWCEILEDLRTCFKTRNFSYMLGLIAELQYAGDKMEAGLRGKNDIEDWEEIDITTLGEAVAKEYLKDESELDDDSSQENKGLDNSFSDQSDKTPIIFGYNVD